MKRFALAGVVAMCLGVAACGTTRVPEPKIVTKEVQVPVPVPCPVKVNPDPEYPDTDAALAAVTDIFQGTKLLKAGRKLRIQREAELKTALNDCTEAK